MTDQVQAHILNKYQLIKKVGSGAYGHVWKVSDRKTGQILALKKIFDAFQHSTDAQRTYREIMFLFQFKNENIIKLHQVFKADNDKDLYLIFEFMEADLHNAIGQKILKDIHNRYILYQILKGIKYLHSASVIHRDLKPSNILVNSDCFIKICDFGLARSLVIDNTQSDPVLTQQVATRWYRAPQVLLGSKNYGKSVDIWSIGCILAQMLNGKPFFPGNSTLNQLQKVLGFTGNPPQSDIDSLQSECAETMVKSINCGRIRSVKQWFRSDTPPQAIDLVVKMLQFNPNKRIKMQEILKHPYISQFRDIKSENQSRKLIKPPVSDNKKLNLKQYRNLIYEYIDKMYQKKDQGNVLNLSVDRPSNSINRQFKQRKSTKTTENVNKSQCPSKSYHFSSTSTSKGFYNSIHRQSPKNPIQSYSNKKILSHSLSQNNFYQNRHSLTNEDENLKRKSSLRELLKQRRSGQKTQNDKFSPYNQISNINANIQSMHPSMQQHSMGNLLQYKYYKPGGLIGQKQNKIYYNKA